MFDKILDIEKNEFEKIKQEVIYLLRDDYSKNLIKKTSNILELYFYFINKQYNFINQIKYEEIIFTINIYNNEYGISETHNYIISNNKETNHNIKLIKYDSPLARLLPFSNINDVHYIYNSRYQIVNITYGEKQNINFLSGLIENIKGLSLNQLKQILIYGLELHGGKGFVHETSLYNLGSIFEHKKIFSKNNLFINNINFRQLGDKELISKTENKYDNVVRNYFIFNSPATFSFENNSCIILIDYNILFSNELLDNMFISEKIKVSRSSKWIDVNNRNQLFNFIKQLDFNNLFSENVNVYDYKNLRMIEFLVKDSIDFDLFKSIIFKNNYDYEGYTDNFIRNYKITFQIDDLIFRRSNK